MLGAVLGDFTRTSTIPVCVPADRCKTVPVPAWQSRVASSPPHFARSSRYPPHQRSFSCSRIIHWQIRARSSALTSRPSPLSSRSHTPRHLLRSPAFRRSKQEISGRKVRIEKLEGLRNKHKVRTSGIVFNFDTLVACYRINICELLESGYEAEQYSHYLRSEHSCSAIDTR